MKPMVNPHQIYTQLLLQVYRKARNTFMTHCVYIALFSVCLWLDNVPSPLIQLWAMVAIVAGLWHWLASHRALRRLHESPLTGRNIISDIVAAGIAGLGFGFSALLLPFISLPSQLFIFLMLGAVAVGRLARLSAIPAIYTAFLVGVMAPLVAMLVYIGDTLEFNEHNALIIVLLMFLSLLYSARQLYSDLMDGLMSRFGLENAAGEDKLTQLANRRRFDLILEQEWSHAKRTSTPISLVMIDVDFFKKFNDHYGHQEGDECLAQVAKVLSKSVKRATDLVARYGGEEFVILLNQTTRDDAFKLCENIRHAVESLKLPHRESQLGYVTVSMGGVTLYAQEDMKATTLVKMADEALYRAKASGRNTVAWYEPNFDKEQT